MKHYFSLKSLWRNFCFLGLKNEISENQDIFICWYCLRDSWGLCFCCFICLSGLCAAGKNAALKRTMTWYCHGSPYHGDCSTESLSSPCDVSMFCTCCPVYRAPWHCFRNQQPPLFFAFWVLISWSEAAGLLYCFVLFVLVLADFLGGAAIHCLSIFGSCFPFFVLHTKCNPPLSCISVDNYGSIKSTVWNHHFHHLGWIVAANGISTQVALNHSS